MTDSWAPAPESVLASRDAPISFTAAASFVTVSFGSGRPEETAYRGDVFVYPYLASTRVGDSFTLRRLRGWPASPTVYVEESNAGPKPWGVLRAIDFAALEPASFTPGAATIAGLPWWLKGALTQSGGVIHSSDLIAGTGLRIRVNFASEGTDTANNLRWFLPLAGVPGYNPNAEVAVWARIDAPGATGENFSNAIVGLCTGDPSAASLTLTQRQTRVGFGTRGNEVSTATGWTHNTVADTSIAGGLAPAARVHGVHKLCGTKSRRMVAPSEVSAPDPYAAADLLSNPNADTARAHGATDSSLGVYFATNFNGGGTRDFFFRELYIMQPGAGAS